MVRPHAAPNSAHRGQHVNAAEPFEMPSYRPEPWTLEAECRDTDEPDLWHDRPGSNRTKYALSVCAVCPVRAECLEYAVRKRIGDGIWGGVTEKELRALLRKAYDQAKAKSFVVIRPRTRKAKVS